MTQSVSRKNNILIVDDTPENLSVLRQLLTERGYLVRPALSGEIALKAVKTQIPDLILLDIMMPDMDGYEVCSILKLDKATAHIPIIFISALTEVGEILKAFQAGGVDYITKPFRTEEVLARVKTHLQLQTAISEKEAAHMMLQTILDSIDNAIITVDSQLQIINANKPLHSICGNIPGDKRTFQQRLQEGRGPCAEVLQQAVTKQQKVKEYRVECNCGHQNGKTLVLNAAPLAKECSETRGAVLVIRDISRLAQLEKELLEQHSYYDIIGKTDGMQKIYTLLKQTADLDINVLITGESGTGKELIADAIHFASNRSNKPFIKVNCAALSESLLESELFGHVSGAYTGAVKDRVGRCQAAEGGTLFLDEIGDISPNFQAKLLRFLEQKEFERIGDSKTLKADVRVVAATNQNLQEKVKTREFREDLFYRLKSILIRLPALRERNDDIPLLVNHFLDTSRRSLKKNIQGLNDDVTRLFQNYQWPGNIRELKSTIHYACALCTSDVIEKEHLPPEFLSAVSEGCYDLDVPSPTDPSSGKTTSEKDTIISTLHKTDWNKAKTARLLGMSRATLYSKLLKYGIGDTT
ncbi:sigma 54-interacting transcriptional regulator [Desulfopila sp. IMCC35008]|uniref:sigma 54-interacting transcriptional regulator n=1 Tax=Desulfopila sp. IMCC35008 TaxID=2653858 RepID=UPI0013D8B594|nr:sigma 54-interacting transcriptional regulator [Desulfopila sp. IMCC35008]